MRQEKHQRLEEIFRRLAAIPAATHAAEAFEQLATIMNAVEDDLSGMPHDPSSWASDGRLYPPQEDAARPVPGRVDLVRYRTRGHNVYIRSNGALEIRKLDEHIVFSKPGVDGRAAFD